MRVLILAYDFPPNSSIGGQRPYSWFKYFKDFGVKPVVVTRHWSEISTSEDTIKPCGNHVDYIENESGTLIRVPFRPNLRDKMLLRFGYRFKLLRKIISLWYSLSQFHLPFFDNRRNMYYEARAYLEKNPCEAIIATGEPFILFQYAMLLSREFNIPWVADYRDGWSTDYHILAGTSRIEKWINKNIVYHLERQIVSSCALITTPAQAFKEDLLHLHSKKKIEVLYNGFFSEMFEPLMKKGHRTNQPFIIAYSGTLYPYQKLNIFIDGFEKFVRLNALSPSEIQIHFLGLEYQPDQMKRLLDYKPDLNAFIKITGRIPHIESLIILNQADVLLLLTNASFGQIYAKVFDYVALGKPILMYENDHGPLEQILNDSGTGYIADNSNQVCEQLSLLYQNAPSATINAAHVQKYSRKHQAERLANIIKSFLQIK
jgi:glycosyltransferase involved in cell wall biosynthesis